MAETFPRGRFVWHELMASDTDAAVAFYKKVVGWSVVPFEGGPPGYRMWVAGDTTVGGVMQLPAEAKQMGAPPHWVPYIAVPDVDASSRQAVALGGRVYVQPTEISVGKFAILADPQGATFALYRGNVEQGGSDGATKPGEFSWHELLTTNADAAWQFYHTMFGWVKTDAMDMGPQGVYQMFGRGGTPMGGMYNLPAGAPMAHWLSYVRVPSADKAATVIAKLGGKVMFGPMEVPGGDRIVSFTDPQGAWFAAHAVKAPAEKPAARKAKTATKKKAAPPRKAKKAKPKKAAPKRKAAAKQKKSARPKTRRKAAPKRKAKKKTARRR